MSCRSRRQLRAFSLVELLVVMAIIAILIGLLLPSLSKARAQVARTRCLNQIAQIGRGITLYITDWDVLPPADRPATSSKSAAPAPLFYSDTQTGLLAMQAGEGFGRSALVCPEGWASSGDTFWYESKGLNRSGAAYMDYAYWGGRYAPGNTFDVRSASFAYTPREKKVKILVTDVVTDLASPPAGVAVGAGNHAGNHAGRPQTITRTDGQGHLLGATNHVRSHGSSVLFSDGHADWFPVHKLTQQQDGICYPPVDQW